MTPQHAIAFRDIEAPQLVDDPIITGEVARIAREQLGYLRTDQLLANGIPISVITRRVRDGLWRRPTRGVVDVARDHPATLPTHTRMVRAAVLVLAAYGPGAIAVGFTALVLYGVWGVPLMRQPQISLPRASRRLNRSGMRCRRFRKGVTVRLVHGVRAVPPVIALAQAICEVSPRTALGILDSALYRGVITPVQIADVREATRGRRGCRRLIHVWAIIDERRESPPESHAWMDLWEVGLEPTDIQIEIIDDAGNLIARPDIGLELDDGSWIFIDIDGEAYHAEGNDRDPARDARLIDLLAQRGVAATVLRFRPKQLGRDGEMTEQVREAIGGRGLRRRRPAYIAA